MDKLLAMKIYNVMCATEGLEKTTEVGSGKNAYKAIGEATVLNEIKPLLKAQKLIMFPSKTVATEITETYPDPYDKNKSKLKSLTQLVITFTLADAETGESIDIEVCGSGYDALDKGAGKASTYAYKIALQKTFMLFSGEDTDNHNTNDIVESQGKTETKNNAVKTLSEGQVKRLYAIAIGKGYSTNSVTNAVKTKYNKDTVNLLTKKQYDELCNAYETSEHKS